MNQRGELVGRQGDGEGPNWVSRDYAGVNPPCRVQCCRINKNGKCSLPSLIEIAADGRCVTAVAEIAAAVALGAQKKKVPVDGD